MASSPRSLPFKPRARLLQLLGDQLIGNSRLAVFELVKNAYDADADLVTVSINDLDTDNANILVEDDGDGMSLETIENIWLVPGDDHREKQKQSGKRTHKGRLPLGEKGLGRFAAHKLGDKIDIVTRASGEPECVIDIDWNILLEKKYLSEAVVNVSTREPLTFIGDVTGTQITVSKLRGKKWVRGEVRRLYRQILSISSPFGNALKNPEGESYPSSDFETKLLIPQKESWLKGLPSVQTILKEAFWHCQFTMNENAELQWEYEFTRIPELKLAGRTDKGKSRQGEFVFNVQHLGETRKGNKPVVRRPVNPSDLQGIGALIGEFHIFYFDRAVQDHVTSLSIANEFMKTNGGVRVYRDGVRVYNYGEPEDDWLGLDLSRVQDPTTLPSNNVILGAVSLSTEVGMKLHEKSNREGFIENDEYETFRQMLISIIRFFARKIKDDRDDIKLVVHKRVDPVVKKIQEPIAKLRAAAREKNVLDDLEKYIVKIEIDFEDMQNTILNAGMPGLSLALVFHEIARGVNILTLAALQGAPLTQIQEQATQLNSMLENIGDLLRADKQILQGISKSVRQARQIFLTRFRYHQVKLVTNFLEETDDDFDAKYSLSMIINVLTNLFDNSFYWMQSIPPEHRKIYIGMSYDIGNGPALVVADTGIGFDDKDSPSDLIRPFSSRKTIEDDRKGTGLGLYYVNMAMQLHGGKLIFPVDRENTGVPDEFDGAVIALLFEDE